LEGKTPQSLGNPAAENLELCDRWILSRYHQTVATTRNYIENYGLGEAAKGLYEFIWGDFCDWYIELVKSRLLPDADGKSKQVAQQTLAYVLEGILKLLHPFMPHITEEIWHTLTQKGEDECLALQAYPEADKSLIDAELEQQFELLFGTIRTIRNLRADSDIKPSVKITVILQSESEKERLILTATESYIQDLAKVKNLTITPSLDSNSPLLKGGEGGSIAGVVGTVQVIIPLAGVVDIAALRAKLEKKLGKVEAEAKSISARLNNPKFVEKATDEVVQGAKDALAEAEKQAEILRDRLSQF
jgi:valyl-tRNA synthetase